MKIILIGIQIILIFIIVPYICYVQETHLTFIFTEITVFSLLVPMWYNHSEVIYKFTQKLMLQCTNPTFYIKSRVTLKSTKQYDNLLGTIEKAIKNSQKFNVLKCAKNTDLTYRIELQSYDKNLTANMEVFDDGQYIYIDLIDSNIGYRDTERIIDYAASLTEIISNDFGITEYVIGMTLHLTKKNPFLGLYFNSKTNQLEKLSSFNLRINENQTTDVTIDLDRIYINSRSFYDFDKISRQYLLFNKITK